MHPFAYFIEIFLLFCPKNHNTTIVHVCACDDISCGLLTLWFRFSIEVHISKIFVPVRCGLLVAFIRCRKFCLVPLQMCCTSACSEIPTFCQIACTSIVLNQLAAACVLKTVMKCRNKFLFSIIFLALVTVVNINVHVCVFRETCWWRQDLPSWNGGGGLQNFLMTAFTRSSCTFHECKAESCFDIT